MSLPESPKTRREQYLARIAGQDVAIPEYPETREEEYLDEIARNGGGGGGDVTGVKGNAETDYRRGNVNITAANIGAYTSAETDILLNGKADTTDLADKTDKVTTATKNNLAAFDDSGNLKDSGKAPTDFAPADIVPSTASTSNKLSTASDTAGEEIAGTATGTSITLTDSADGYVQGVTVKGHSEVVDGAIKSIGDAGWGVVDLGDIAWAYSSTYGYFAGRISDGLMKDNSTLLTPEYTFIGRASTTAMQNAPNMSVGVYDDYIRIKNTAYTDATLFTAEVSGQELVYELADTTGATPIFGITSKDGAGQGTNATITTGLPLRSVSDSIFDTLDNDKVTKKCFIVDLGDLTWTRAASASNTYTFRSGDITGIIDAAIAADRNKYILSPDYVVASDSHTTYNAIEDGEIMQVREILAIRDDNYDNAPDFTSHVTGMKVICTLATPTETALSSAEKFALNSLKTYSTTHIDATDEPTITVDYLLNTDNGKAVAKVDKKVHSHTRTVLFDNNYTETQSNITLSEDFRNFDYLEIQSIRISSGETEYTTITQIVSTEALIDLMNNDAQKTGVFSVIGLAKEWVDYRVASGTSWTFLAWCEEGRTKAINKIIGITI